MKLAEYQVIKLNELLDKVVAERDELRVQLASATQRAETAEARVRLLKAELTIMTVERDAWQRRVKAEKTRRCQK